VHTGTCVVWLCVCMLCGCVCVCVLVMDSHRQCLPTLQRECRYVCCVCACVGVCIHVHTYVVVCVHTYVVVCGVECTCVGLARARTICHIVIYTRCINCNFGRGNYQIYGHIWDIYIYTPNIRSYAGHIYIHTIVTNPTPVKCLTYEQWYPLKPYLFV